MLVEWLKNCENKDPKAPFLVVMIQCIPSQPCLPLPIPDSHPFKALPYSQPTNRRKPAASQMVLHSLMLSRCEKHLSVIIYSELTNSVLGLPQVLSRQPWEKSSNQLKKKKNSYSQHSTDYFEKSIPYSFHEKKMCRPQQIRHPTR